MTTRSPDSISQDIHSKATQTAERSIYSMSNPYTTNDEKAEIEFWYQLPFEISGIFYVVACFYWAQGVIAGWNAFIAVFIVGILTAFVTWFMYNRRLVSILSMLVNFPKIGWLVPFGVAIWLGLSGSVIEAVFLAGNRVLVSMPVGFGGMMTNHMLTAKYKMHPKYAFLKHFYGKSYSFDE